MINLLKKLGLLFGVITLMGIQTVVAQQLASDKITPMVAVTRDGKLKVAYANPGRKRVLLELVNSRNEKLYQLRRSDDRFAQLLNLNELGDGAYRFILKAEDQKLVYEIWIETQTRFKLKPNGNPQQPDSSYYTLPEIFSTRL